MYLAVLLTLTLKKLCYIFVSRTSFTLIVSCQTSNVRTVAKR